MENKHTTSLASPLWAGLFEISKQCSKFETHLEIITTNFASIEANQIIKLLIVSIQMCHVLDF